MNKFDITKEEMAAISRYIDSGERSDELDSAIGKIFYAEGQIRSRLLREADSLRGRLGRTSAKLERIEDAKKEAVLQGEFGETGLDSVDVAKCLLYYLQGKDSYGLTKSKLMCILFEVYASWLYSKKERIFIEHPVCTEYGPQFWRVYKRINSVREPLGRECVDAVASANPGVAAMCRNAANKYYDYSEKQLQSFIIKCPAYKAALPKNNGGKWNGEMSDRLIYSWKEEQKND